MRILIFILVAVILSACNKDELGPQYLNSGNDGTGGQILILNEGNFGWSNGSMSILHTGSGDADHQVFLDANGFGLGDVVQSAQIIDGQLFVVVNNSGKIEVIDPDSFQNIGTISGMNSPRYLLQVQVNQSYVSDLYSNSIQIINHTALQQVSSIPMPGWTEKMAIHSGEVYVSLPEERELLIIDPVSHQVSDTIEVRKGADMILKDVNGLGWLMCSGGINEDIPVLYKINLSTHAKVDSLEFSSVSERPGNLVMNSNSDSLYFVNTDVFGMSINDLSLPSNAIYQSNGQAFYSLYLDSVDRHLYISDVKDYIQNSTIHKISTQGVLKTTFDAGVISNNMLRLK